MNIPYESDRCRMEDGIGSDGESLGARRASCLGGSKADSRGGLNSDSFGGLNSDSFGRPNSDCLCGPNSDCLCGPDSDCLCGPDSNRTCGFDNAATFDNILDAIGHTPLVRINRLNPRPEIPIYAKLEGFNPTGSIKDRIALKMIQQAEADGALVPGKIIIEPTSGNTGIGLAMIGAVKGYAVEIVMSEAVSVERRKMIEAFGAVITLTPAAEGTDGAIRRAHELCRLHPDRYFMPNQFSNEYNKLAHYCTTAAEIWEQTEGRITHVVSALGTSGTIMGVGKGLKDRNPAICTVEAHPVRGHYIQGLKNMEEAIVPEIYDPAAIDIRVMVESEAAFQMAREIVLKEGIFVGMSSGAAMLAALECQKTMNEGFVVVLFADRGEKYLSTDLFSGRDA